MAEEKRLDKNGNVMYRSAKKGFIKGKSGNPNGRPVIPLEKTPMGMLNNALDAGMDLGSLKDLALRLVQDKNTKMTPSQIERLVSKLFDVELELMKRADVAAEKKNKNKEKRKSNNSKSGSTGIFSTTAGA